jgi:hypothetical protein
MQALLRVSSDILYIFKQYCVCVIGYTVYIQALLRVCHRIYCIYSSTTACVSSDILYICKHYCVCVIGYTVYIRELMHVSSDKFKVFYYSDLSHIETRNFRGRHIVIIRFIKFVSC